MGTYILCKPEKYLILASYCGANEECSEDYPCKACLEMCNVAIVPIGTKIEVLGGFEYINRHKRGQ